MSTRPGSRHSNWTLLGGTKGVVPPASFAQKYPQGYWILGNASRHAGQAMWRSTGSLPAKGGSPMNGCGEERKR
jgi:hypothetical protein